MAKWNVPSEGKAVELTSKILEEQIQKALKLALEYKEEAQIKAKGNYKLDARWTTRRTKTWKKRIESLGTQIKKLRRGLGGVILTNPEYYKKTGLFKKIAENVNDPEKWVADLASALGTWDDEMAQTTKVNKFNPAGKVGHHRTALGVLRDAIEPLDVDVRAEFKRLALADGYKVGEEFLDYIDPAAHKALTKNIYGVLRDKLNIKHVDEIDPKHKHIFEALVERSAHAAAYGKESGIVMPKELLKKGANADEVYRYARPYLELQKRGADAGLQLDEILTSNRWNTLEDLFEVVQKEMPLADTTPILNKMRVDLMESGLYDPKIGRAKIKGRGYVQDLPKAGLSVEDVYKNVWEPVDARGLRGLTRQIEPVTEAGQVLFSKTNDFSDAVKPVGGGVAALTADSFAPTGYNKLTEQAQKVGNKLVEAKDAANLKQLSTIGKRAAMLNPLMFGASTGLGALALQDRIKEVAANPDDPWLKFQLRLDQTALGADATGLTSSAAALTGWGALVPAAAEITSNVASGASLALDFGRWVKDPEAREDTLEWWTSVYQRGSRGLIKGLQQVF